MRTDGAAVLWMISRKILQCFQGLMKVPHRTSAITDAAETGGLFYKSLRIRGKLACFFNETSLLTTKQQES